MLLNLNNSLKLFYAIVILKSLNQCLSNYTPKYESLEKVGIEKVSFTHC